MSDVSIDRANSLSDLWDISSRYSVTQLMIAFTVIVAVLDVILNFGSSTEIPYDYYAIASFLHIIVVAHFFPKVYDIGRMFAEELAEITDNQPSNVTAIETELTGDDIRTQMQELLSQAFAIKWVILGGIATATLGIVGGFLTGLFDVISYWLIGALFLFAHGLFFIPAAFGVLIVNKITNEYITDIDVISPDGVGGYEEIGNGIITVASYALFLTTLDFIVISAISYTPSSSLQAVVGAAFGMWVILVLSYIVYVIVSIRSRLMEIRDVKFQKLKSQFKGTETAYWSKQSGSEDRRQEALDMMAMRSMFNELNQMDLWPVNIVSLTKMSASTAFSIVVFAVDRGLIPSPANFLL